MHMEISRIVCTSKQDPSSNGNSNNIIMVLKMNGRATGLRNQFAIGHSPANSEAGVYREEGFRNELNGRVSN